MIFDVINFRLLVGCFFFSQFIDAAKAKTFFSSYQSSQACITISAMTDWKKHFVVRSKDDALGGDLLRIVLIIATDKKKPEEVRASLQDRLLKMGKELGLEQDPFKKVTVFIIPESKKNDEKKIEIQLILNPFYTVEVDRDLEKDSSLQFCFSRKKLESRSNLFSEA